MSDYSIFWRTMTIAIPTCAAVPLFGLLFGGIVAVAAAVAVALEMTS